MKERIEGYLQKLVEIPGLSGHEQRVADYMGGVFREQGMDVTLDIYGNCIGSKKAAAEDADTLMIFAHMDSLGFVVNYIEPDGYIRLERLGGIPEKVLPATRVVITTKEGKYIDGVIGVKSHHVTPPEEKYVVDKYKDVFVDIGASSKQEALALGIDVGCPVVYKPYFQKMLNDRVAATAMDDRSGCAAVLELASRLAGKDLPLNLSLVGTAQEEYNLRGAMMAARTVKPRFAICIDCSPVGDTPDLRGRSDTRMGGGPVMTLYNFHGRGTLNGTIAHPAMVRAMEKASAQSGIKMQRAAYIGGLTDLSYLQLEGEGVIGIDMGFPMRYAHAPGEVCELGDIDLLVDILVEVIGCIADQEDWAR